MSFRKVKVTAFGRRRDGTTSVESGALGPSTSRAWRERQDARRAAQVVRAPQVRVGRGGDQAPDDDPDAWQAPDSMADPPSDAEDVNDESGGVLRELLDTFLRDSPSAHRFASSSNNWGRRRVRARENWNIQLDELVNEYLAFVHSRPTPSGAPAPSLWPQHAVSAEVLKERRAGCIRLVDISGVYEVPTAFILAQRTHLNAALLSHGYLGSSPVQPAIAFSLRALLLFGRLRIRARTGKHNFVRVLCDLHNITFSKSFRDRFSEASDALSLIQRKVDDLVLARLGRDIQWRMKNACPACSYACVDEGPLVYARQFAIDGNNSMKRFISAGTRHDFPYEFRYFKTRAEVDEFKHEVRRGQQERRTTSHADAAAADAAAAQDTECTQRWRNAAPENERSRSSDVVDETGIFVCTCRHGFVVLVTDMWQSGELAKYPLTIVKTLIDLFHDEGKIEVGYDIGCAHSVTAGSSSFGQLAQEHVRFVVGSFHGHAHDRYCQLRFHPRYIAGSGREDFEGCERLFSVNNFIAPLVRHATRYHRHELIEASLRAWDADKYAALGSLLLNKFVEAKAKISEHSDDERQRKRNPEYTDDFFAALLADERDYLAGRPATNPDTVAAELASAYAAVLRQWWETRAARDQLDPFIQHVPGARDGTNRKWLAVQRKLQTYEEHLERYEQRLGIAAHERWTRASREYTDTLQSDQRRAYDSALDALERSVADRTAVLEKLNRRGTGYSLRRQIAKAVSRRGAAFGVALQKYNEAALALVPPRPTLTREEVDTIAALAEFPLLREDTGVRPWAQPTVRRLTTAWAETKRSEEELQRVRIEAARVRAWIRDEQRTLDTLIADLAGAASPRDALLAKEVDTRAQLLFQVHTTILEDLLRLDMADGHAQAQRPGVRPGQTPDTVESTRPAARHPLPQLPEDFRRAWDVQRRPDQDNLNASDTGSENDLLLDDEAEQDLDTILTAIDRISD